MTAIELYGKFNAYLEEKMEECDENVKNTSELCREINYLKRLKREDEITDEMVQAKRINGWYRFRRLDFKFLQIDIDWYENGKDMNGNDMTLKEMYETLMCKIDDGITKFVNHFQQNCLDANKKLIKYINNTKDYWLEKPGIGEQYISNIFLHDNVRNMMSLYEMKDKLNELYYSYSKSYV